MYGNERSPHDAGLQLRHAEALAGHQELDGQVVILAAAVGPEHLERRLSAPDACSDRKAVTQRADEVWEFSGELTFVVAPFEDAEQQPRDLRLVGRHPKTAEEDRRF